MGKRGISPVIATVILVAVTITIAVAVAFWMGGIAGQYTKFEKIEIQSVVCKKYSGKSWNITMMIKNSGTAQATLTNIFINDRDVANYSYPHISENRSIATNMTKMFTIDTGQVKYITIWIGILYPPESPLSSGTTVNIKIHSAGGMDYIKLVELP
jgi:flagellin-like protein